MTTNNPADAAGPSRTPSQLQRGLTMLVEAIAAINKDSDKIIGALDSLKNVLQSLKGAFDENVVKSIVGSIIDINDELSRFYRKYDKDKTVKYTGSVEENVAAIVTLIERLEKFGSNPIKVGAVQVAANAVKLAVMPVAELINFIANIKLANIAKLILFGSAVTILSLVIVPVMALFLTAMVILFVVVYHITFLVEYIWKRRAQLEQMFLIIVAFLLLLDIISRIGVLEILGVALKSLLFLLVVAVLGLFFECFFDVVELRPEEDWKKAEKISVRYMLPIMGAFGAIITGVAMIKISQVVGAVIKMWFFRKFVKQLHKFFDLLLADEVKEKDAAGNDVIVSGPGLYKKYGDEQVKPLIKWLYKYVGPVITEFGAVVMGVAAIPFVNVVGAIIKLWLFRKVIKGLYNFFDDFLNEGKTIKGAEGEKDIITGQGLKKKYDGRKLGPLRDWFWKYAGPVIIGFEALILLITEMTFKIMIESIIKMWFMRRVIKSLGKFFDKLYITFHEYGPQIMKDFAISLGYVYAVIVGFLAVVFLIKQSKLRWVRKKIKKMTRIADEMRFFLTLGVLRLAEPGKIIQAQWKDIAFAYAAVTAFVVVCTWIKVAAKLRGVPSKVKKMTRILGHLLNFFAYLVGGTVHTGKETRKITTNSIANKGAKVQARWKDIVFAFAAVTFVATSLALIGLAAPSYLMFVVFYFPIKLAFKFFFKLVDSTLDSAQRMSQRNTSKKDLINFLIILGMFTAIFLTFLLLSQLARLLKLPDFVKMLKLLAFITAFELFLWGFGKLAMLVQPVLPAAMAVMATIDAFFGMILVMCGAIVGIAEALKKIEEVELDVNTIMIKVGLIMACVAKIFTWFLTPPQNFNGGANQEPAGIGEMLGGAVANFLSSIFATITLVLTIFAVVAVFIIALMLKGIEKLDLNQNKIKRSVDVVISTCESIIAIVLGGDNTEAEATNKTGGEVIAEAAMNGLTKIIAALMAFAYLFLMVFAIASILFIAGLLKAIEMLKLNPDKINTNVNLVLTTCQNIIDNIFQPDQAQKQDSDKGGIEAVVEYFVVGLGKIIAALLAVAYLFLMFIAVGLILALAGELKLIEMIELDKDKITGNVGLVLGTTQSILDSIFKPDDSSIKESKHGALLWCIEWAFGKGVANMIMALISIAYLFLMMIVIFLVLAIAKQLEQIADIDKDKIADAKIRAEAILTGTNDIMELLINGKDVTSTEASEDETKKELFSFLGFGAIFKALMMIMGLAMAELALGSIQKIGEALVAIGEMEVDVDAAKTKACALLGAAFEVLHEIMEPKQSFKVAGIEDYDDIEDFLDDFNDAFEELSKSIQMIASLPESFDAILEGQELDDAKIDLIGKKVRGYREAAIKVADAILGADDSRQVVNRAWANASDKQKKEWKDKPGWWTGDYSDSRAIEELVKKHIESAMETLEWKFGLVSKVTSKMKGVVSDVSSMNEDLKKLETLATINKDGIVKHAVAMKNVVDSIIEAFTEKDDALDISVDKQVGDIMKRIEGTSKIVKSYTAFLGDFKEFAGALSDIKITDNKGKKTPSQVIQQYNSMIDELSKPYNNSQKKNLDLRTAAIQAIQKAMQTTLQVSDKDVANLKAQTKNYVDFLEKVNKMDISRLRSLENLMKYWSTITEKIGGDFNGLAKALNEHVSPAIDKLNESMDKVTETQNKIIEELNKDVTININNPNPSDYRPNPDEQRTVQNNGTPPPEHQVNTPIGAPVREIEGGSDDLRTIRQILEAVTKDKGNKAIRTTS